MVDPVRRVAWDVLRAVEQRDAYVNLLLPSKLAEAGLSGRDAAFVTELTHGTIRRQGSYDAILDRVSSGAIDPPVRDVLRLGTHQLLAMRTPTHAAVSTSVDLVRKVVGHKPASFVNAILRKVARDDFDGWMRRVAPAYADDPIAHLSVVYSHPRWIVEALRDALGGDLTALRDTLAANNAAPLVSLVARPGTTDADYAELAAAGAVAGTYSRYAYRLDSGQPRDLGCVRDGRVGVQDEGSQLVAIAAADAALTGADTRWLDLCAGPGGKAALLAALASERDAVLTANEPRPHRADLVRNAVRGYPAATVTSVDGRDRSWAEQQYDRVLVDAPCSGIGALRRRPEARWRRSDDDLPDLVRLQTELLDSAIGATRTGGLITYATCSPHTAETQDVIAAALDRRDDIEQLDTGAVLGSVGSAGPTVQLWPHIHGTDAMFIACLRRC